MSLHLQDMAPCCCMVLYCTVQYDTVHGYRMRHFGQTSRRRRPPRQTQWANQQVTFPFEAFHAPPMQPLQGSSSSLHNTDTQPDLPFHGGTQGNARMPPPMTSLCFSFLQGAPARGMGSDDEAAKSARHPARRRPLQVPWLVAKNRAPATPSTVTGRAPQAGSCHRHLRRCHPRRALAGEDLKLTY